MQVTWTDPDRGAWERLHRDAAGALQQHWAYGEAMQALGTRCLRALVTQDGEPAGLAQFLVRRVAGVVPLALCTHGPVWRASLPDPERERLRRAIGAGVPLHRPRAVLYTPEAARAEAGGVAGLRRVVTGHATVRLDLARPGDALRAAMHGKWRNRLAAAERSALKVERVGGKPAQYRWLLERELSQRGARGYIALPDGFVEAYQTAYAAGGHGREGSADPLLTLRADLGRDAVAGMMFVVHGAAATYQVGWVGDAGRELGAHNLLLWQGMLELQRRGVRVLDLGGVDTQRGAGIARFKIGSGGEVVMPAGTYL